ncbi:MAG: hypothetical protein ACJ76L_07000, partial [Conexibacter sp.]
MSAAAARGWSAPKRRPPILVVGDGDLAHDVEATLLAAGAPARWLHHPLDRELRRELTAGVAAAIVIHRDDFAALRTALLVEHLAPGVRLIVTIFDRTVAEQIKRTVPNCDVLSMADASIGALCGPCLDPGTLAARRGRPLVGPAEAQPAEGHHAVGQAEQLGQLLGAE